MNRNNDGASTVRFREAEPKKKSKSKRRSKSRRKSRDATAEKPKMLRHLSSDFFSSFVDEIEKTSNLKINEPSVESNSSKQDIKPHYENMNGFEWLTSGTLEQMVDFVAGPSQSKYFNKLFCFFFCC